MGFPLGPIAAYQTLKTNEPLLWTRYIDGIFCVYKKHQNANDYLKRINRWHANIRFIQRRIS